MSDRIPLYRQVAQRIEDMITQGVYEPGERLPSIRDVHAEFGVSVNTAREVFRLLEARGVAEARSQSGHFVRQGPTLCTDCQMDYPDVREALRREPTTDALTRVVLADGERRGWVNLAAAMPPAALLPSSRLAEFTARAVRKRPRDASTYTLPPGAPELRQEIAKRVFRGGVSVGPDQVLVTAGCIEAVFLALLSVCSPGDAVLIESPGFYLFYQLLERLHLRAVEVPSRPGTGVDPDALEQILRDADRGRSEPARISAALLIANFSNPIGAVMPEESKRRVAEVLDRHGVVLIEDDIYGEMAWDVDRPASLTAYADPERSLLCASFSKSIAPGYRIGWLVAGGELFTRAVHSKLVTSSAVSGPAVLGVAAFLANGGYDRWLRQARRHYRATVAMLRSVIHDSFPPGTRSTRPTGGLVLWVVLPPDFDTIALYHRLREERIAFAPGPIFSLHGAYRNCLRLNAGSASGEVVEAVRRMGAVARRMGG